ncbi:HK97 gp10 family phage protein [Clostridium tertium]|uniref:HK97-gp10 family putative phage morphogenesis protein n=1 Tax=Clostridium tertium TaxID=1559 RepID=UPI00232B4C5A|nr:HK97-gp10 family putative phage morphogenesis protein [Clostridium tertium]MDB1924062.1 HK97 gp10 family phage protein [Clostridium tertium]MDB1927177.1 HK97 gp10 family phage protein [Clostridium tertium]MDB1930954.1 HK97 gp10 family phage protein [Clostridium tertium]
MAKYKLEGLDEVLKMLKDVESLPQKCVNKSARNGAKISQKDAKNNAPFLTGTLEESISLKAEKTSKKGKKVYQVTLKDNPEFVRITAEGNRYYYPASQEYGFKLKNGGKVEGLHFMKNSIDNNSSKIESTMINVLADEIDKLR